MGTVSRQIFLPLLTLVLFSHEGSGQTEGDVRLKDGPNAYEGRPEIFHDGVWLSLCYTSNSLVPGTICKQLGYPYQGAMRYIANSYGKAPGEIFGQHINCHSHHTNVSQCYMYDRNQNCDPQYTLGISCNTTTSAKKVRLKDGKTLYEGRIEVFKNGVWGTVCRLHERYTTNIHRDINPHIVCRELFGSGYGGAYYPTFETPSRFGILQSGAINIANVKCNGNEDSFLECSHTWPGTATQCNHEIDATVKCFQVPDGCVGYFKSHTGEVKSPGYSASYNFTEDTVCAWKIETSIRRTLNLSVSYIESHNQTDRSSSIQVLRQEYSLWRTSYGSLVPDFISTSNVAFIRQKTRAGTFGIDFAASWTTREINCNSSNTIPRTSVIYLYSPNYRSWNRGKYPPGVDCYQLVQFREQFASTVRFPNFHLDDEVNGTCQDYVEIFEGSTSSDQSLGKFCKHTIPPTLTSSQNKILLHFHTDYIIDDASGGFRAQVIGTEPDPVIKYLNGSSGVVRSPGYPNLYANEIDYKWIITVQPYQFITLNVSNYMSSNCSSNQRLLVFYSRTCQGHAYGNLYCHQKTALIKSSTNALCLWFVSVSEPFEGHKFTASWEASIKSCNYTYANNFSTSYSFQSPGYSGMYPPGVDCYYAVQFREHLPAAVTFHSFHLDDETSGTCQDYLEIFDGASVSDRSLGRFCNSTIPPTLTLTQNTVLLHFHSDDTTDPTSRGFHINVHGVIPDPVIKNLNGDSGLIRSPGYPDLYSNETDYTWIITVPSYQYITLNVSNYTSSTCNNINQKIDIFSPHYRFIRRLNCHQQSASIVRNANTMKLWFDSISLYEGHLFEATWKAVCRSLKYTRVSDTLRSPGSPNTYSTNLDCIYTIITTGIGQYIKLKFTSFNLDSANPCTDYVKIRDGPSADYPLLSGPLCGSSLPAVVTSKSNSLWLEFRSDSATNSSSTGFVATYTSHDRECESETLTSRSGHIASPGYPLHYSRQSYCVWTITIPSDGIVELTFQDFSVGVKNTYDCTGAYVRVYDGDNVDASTVINTLCGATAIPKITSTGRSLTVVLNSFGYSPPSSVGFQAVYTTKSGSVKDQHELFPYGTSKQDSELDQSDYATGHIAVQTGFPFKDKIEHDVYFGNNGLVSIGNSYAWPDLPDARKVICVYCAYIDNSDSVGGIYYHQYTSVESAEVLKKASKEIQEYTETQGYSATLVIVVTWDRVRQGRYRTVNYDPDEDAGESTFQLALVSDGVTTYALVYYKVGYMNWSYRGRWSYVIIGVSNGNPESYHLNFYTRTKRAYLIDTVPGNTGRLGTWLYKVGTVSKNPSGACLEWYYRNQNHTALREPFFSRLPECPCSHRDVWQKTRYLWVKARTDNINNIECYRMNRASSNRFFPFGKECCYSLDETDSNYEQMITTPPFAGSALAYNPIYLYLRESYMTEDKLAHDTCCNPNLTDRLYCWFYYLLRPWGKCRPDFPFRFTWIFGDPHIVTLDEREYTFNGWGEYTLVTLTTEDSDFVLQGRTTPTVTDSGSPVNATVFTAFGAEENGTRVFVQLDPNTNNSLIVYGDRTDYTRKFQEEGDEFIVDEDYFTLMRDNGSLVVLFPSEIGFAVSIGWKSLVLGVMMPEKFRNQTRGLLGNYNTVKTDDFVLPDGTQLNNTLSERQIHYQFGNAWAVTEANSVLRYGPREGPSDFAHPDFTAIFLDEISASDRQASENVCQASDSACIYDFVVSGSEGFALKTKESRQEALKENSEAKNRLPSLQVPDNVTMTTNIAKTFRVSANDPGDTVTYKLANDGKGTIQINDATGEITVTVNPNTPVTLQVYAVDSFQAQSVVRTVPLIVCFGCSGNGQCNFTRVQPAVGNINFQHAACDCAVGWAGANCSEDYDACSSSPCHPLQTCTDQTPAQQTSSSVGYTCGLCPAGYNSPAGQANLCLDVDECEDDALNECKVTCNNTAGSYQCSCPDGHRLTSDLRSCADINECSEKSHDCQHICNNTDGGYRCLCQEGYNLNSSGQCVQSSSTQSICSSSGCSKGCKVVQDPVTNTKVARCFCPSGYDIDPTDNRACVDHDECQDSVCAQNCNNTQGSFNCSCYNGFQLNSDQRTCSPCPSLQYGPECAHTCLCNGRGLDCHSITGCVCQKGWTGSQCQDDVNECEENPDVCGERQLCTNTNGSYTCACQDGYAIDDDGVCQDMDECSNDAACGQHQLCSNVPGSFQCSCVSGYQNKNGTCKDIDECTLSTDNCQQKCVNVAGTYNCECNYGYRLNTDRTTCAQVSDPCAEEENLSCDHGCTLDDTDIAVCFCKSGYTLHSDKQTCQDVNECLDVSKKCSHTCANTAGGFTCSCPSGMVLDNDGKTCVSCPVGTYGRDCSMNCSCGAGASRCDPVTGCVCKTGWTGNKCQNDVNECDVSSTRQQCEAKGAKCVNVQGGYRCRCADGFKANDSGVCQDIDECATSPCSQTCENSAGSYRCLCNTGYFLNSTTGDCTENQAQSCTQACNCSRVTSDRCESESVHDCSGTPNTRCQKSAGGYTCVCRNGYRENSSGACIAATQLGFSVKININIPQADLSEEPSRSTIKKEGQTLLEKTLKAYVPTVLAVSIHNMRPGSVIADVDVDVPSKSAQISASSLSVALVNITGQRAVLAGQTGTVGITVDGMEIFSNTTYCDVFSRYVTCEENQVCKVENGKPQCRQEEDESSSGNGQAACWDSPVNRHCLHLCCNLLPT